MNTQPATALPYSGTSYLFDDFSAQRLLCADPLKGFPGADNDNERKFSEEGDKEGDNKGDTTSLEGAWSAEGEINLVPDLSDWFVCPLQAVFLGIANNPEWVFLPDHDIYLDGLDYVPNGTDLERLREIADIIQDPGKGIETLSHDNMDFLKQLGFRHPVLDNELPRFSYGTYVSPNTMGITGISVNAQMVPKPPLDIESMQNGPQFGSGRTRRYEMDSQLESGFYPQTSDFSSGLPQPTPPV